MKPSDDPKLASEYGDNEPPDGTPVFTMGSEGSYNDITRRILAIITVSILGILYVATFISFLLGLIDYTKFQQAMTATYVLTGLTAAVFLYFFRGRAISRKIRRALKAFT